jgi:hypothetical protein
MHPSKKDEMNKLANAAKIASDRPLQKHALEIHDDNEAPAEKKGKQQLTLAVSKASYVSQATVDKLILDYVLHSAEPFRTVELPSFKALVTGLRPDRKCMCRNTLVTRIDQRFKEWKNKLCDELLVPSFVCTTTDCWSSRNKSYIGFTVHWINPETLDHKSSALACRRIKGQHTYNVLASIIEKVNIEFHIHNKTIKTVTDNGSNFCKAFRLFSNNLSVDEDPVDNETTEANDDNDSDEIEPILITGILREQNDDNDESESYSLPPHHKCTAHTLNLVATKDALDAEKDASYKKLSRSTFAKCQALWNKQSRSPLAADTIKDKCGVYFILPNATRWNSTFDAMQGLVKIGEQNLLLLCDALGVQKFRPPEILFISEYCRVMNPVAASLDKLQSEKQMYMGYLLPTLTILKQRLLVLQNAVGNEGLRFCVPLAKSLLLGVETRFGALFNDNELLLASVLHPKFKLNWLSSQEEKEAAKRALSVSVKAYCSRQEHSEVNEPAGRVNTTVATAADDDDEFYTFTASGESVSSNKELENMELYLNQANTTLLSLNSFPVLKALFIKYNTGIPSSAPVERLFSAGGGIMVPNRANLSDENFEKQLMLNANKF